MYYVYVHTFPNGKRYVGVTIDTKRRWGKNGHGYHNPYMKNAIEKYGWENVKHEIVAEVPTEKEASKMEMELIAKYDSANRLYGYNISLGGVECKRCSEETKQKLRAANIGKKLSEETKRKIGEGAKRKYSDEQRKHMSEAQKKSFANGNRAMHSPEARAKAAQKNKGRKASAYVIQRASEAKFRPVMDLETGISYESIIAASIATGQARTTISRNLRGKNKTKKQRWKYLTEKKKRKKEEEV